MKRFRRRRRFLVLNFQYQLLAVNVLYFLSILLIFAGILFIPVMIQLGSSPLSRNEALEAANQFLSLHARIWPGILIVFVLLVLHSILISHRIAGPLYRFRSFFKAVADGHLGGRVRIRKNDYLHEDAQAINDMISSLRIKAAVLREHSRQALAALGQLSDAIEPASSAEITRTLKVLNKQMEQLNTDIEQLTIADEELRSNDKPAS